MLFDFLFQICKCFRMEKFVNRDTQTVTKFFDRRNRCAVISAADDIVDGRLRYTAYTAQFVERDLIFLTKFYDSLSNSFSYRHGYHPFSSKMISIST